MHGARRVKDRGTGKDTGKTPDDVYRFCSGVYIPVF